MGRIVGIAMLVVGVVLLGFGFDARDSFSSDVSNTFTGSPTDKAIWLLGLGAFFAITGLGSILFGGRARVRG